MYTVVQHAQPHRRVADWARQHKKALLIGGALVILAVIIGQLLYPVDKGLPGAFIKAKSVMFVSQADISKHLEDTFAAATMTLKAGDMIVHTPLKSVGAIPDTEKMTKQLIDYPFWQRLIPFSLVFNYHSVDALDVYFDTKVLQSSVGSIAHKLSKSPESARLAIKDGVVVATVSQVGYSTTADDIVRAVASSRFFTNDTTVVVKTTLLPVSRTSKDIAQVRTRAESVISKQIILAGDEKTFSPDAAAIASWIIVGEDTNGNITLKADSEKITQYLNDINAKVRSEPGFTQVELSNGREVSRTEGAEGRGLAVDEIRELIEKSLFNTNQKITIPVKMQPIAPIIRYSNGYTATEDGLRAYISDVARTRNMHIMVEQLDGNKWTAEARARESIPSGSTYKLYVSLVLFDRMEKGEVAWGDPMLDTNVSGCFDRMTIASTNPCAEKWIAMFSRPYINEFIYDRGFSDGTTFTTGSANQTTAADLNKFMTGLNDGTLVKSPYRERLLSSLEKHPYQYGIPAGSKGVVHDKVGFLWDYVHDTAIVQHPRGTYIMTVMTKGQSYAAIAEVTREVERLMYP